jgi:hypothetical protein
MKIQPCCTKRGAMALACAKIRAPRRRTETNEGHWAVRRTAGIASRWVGRGSSGDYPEKDSIRVGASEGATR